MAYGAGLRHALDADHLATIDSALRLDVHRRDGSAGAGLFFSLGHSTVVLAMCALFFFVGESIQHHVHLYMMQWSVIGNLVSIVFLLAAGMMTLLDGRREVFHGRRGRLLILCRGAMHYFSARPWGLYLLGLLFALGFDTTAEVSLLGVSATQLMRGVSVWRVLLLPCLFTAGMVLCDTLDGIGAWRLYRQSWCNMFLQRRYRLYLTFISASMAISISIIQINYMIKGDLFIKNSNNGCFYFVISRINIGLFFSFIMVFVWIVFSIRRRCVKR
ncbi:hypothetical protein GS501_01500 [Saccharibacter sp. 17.LH.SD]|nr:hypothetical protein [Saccharibacter sp. 17.LH.SD]